MEQSSNQLAGIAPLFFWISFEKINDACLKPLSVLSQAFSSQRFICSTEPDLYTSILHIQRVQEADWLLLAFFTSLSVTEVL